MSNINCTDFKLFRNGKNLPAISVANILISFTIPTVRPAKKVGIPIRSILTNPVRPSPLSSLNPDLNSFIRSN